jgi:formylglycine-generating enzyme required for sulfatase activity
MRLSISSPHHLLRVLTTIAAAGMSSLAYAQTCSPDINGDGVVDASDLSMVLASWGTTYPATIESVSPAQGPASGGTVITILGTGLGATSVVRVGGVSCANVTVIAANEVRATTPSGKPGAASVSVTTPAGTTTVEAAFVYGAVTTPLWATLIEAAPDPAVVTNPSLRAAIVATGYAWRVRDNLTQIEMVLIPPGSFNMGCSPSSVYSCVADENPVHPVTLTNAFYMGRYEVTQAQWTARMGSNPSFFQSPSAQVRAAQVPNRPVETVSWNAIQGFLASAGVRLPTEAEWEYACRAGTTTAFHSMPGFPDGTNDDSVVGLVAWTPSNSESQTRVVGGKPGNALGLHDMHGNVWEIVGDFYSSTYYADSPGVNPPGPATGSSCVMRGESWNPFGDNDTRVSRRAALLLTVTSDDIGFRVARNP